MLLERAGEAGAAEKLFRIAIVLGRRAGDDLLKRDGELVRIERSALTDFFAWRDNLVPGLQGSLLPSRITQNSQRPQR